MALHAAGRLAEAADQYRLCQRLLPSDPAPFLNLATVLLELHDPPAALEAAKRARRRAMHMPQAHYMVGVALLALGRLEDAIQAFADTLRYDPHFVDAWVNLGVIRYRRGNMEGAKQAMRQAVAIEPGHRAATSNLATFLWITGESEEGEALLHGMLARDPDAIEARLNHAAQLLQAERAADALAVLDERPPTRDAGLRDSRLQTHWRLQRALALLYLDRPEEARSELACLGEPPPELAPLLLWRRVLLAVADNDITAARRYAQDMAQAIAAPAGLLPEHHIMAHYDLARFWAAHGERDQAFAHWTAGHRLLARFQPFSRDIHRRFIDASIQHLHRTRLAEGPCASNRDPAPVFIVGMPRSGTTLTEQIIGAHRQAFAAGERVALPAAFTALGGGTSDSSVARIAGLDAAALDKQAASYLAALHALAPDATRIVDKLPGNFLFLGLIALMLPGAKIIHCVRDPRDIGLSIFTFRFYGYHPYAHDLGDLGWFIAEHCRLMAHWRAVLPNPILTVHLQDWVTDFDATLRRVLDFLELPYDPACERFHEQETTVRTVSRVQVRQPINASGLNRWRAYEPHLQPLIAALGKGGVLPEDARQPAQMR